MFCKNCKIPISNYCDHCGYNCKGVEGLAPVYREELEILRNKIPDRYKKNYVFFRRRNLYFLNGEIIAKRKYINNQYYIALMQKELTDIKNIDYIIKGNKTNLDKLEKKSIKFIRDASNYNKGKKLYLAFSGGKDSLALYILAKKAKVPFQTLVYKIGNEMVSDKYLVKFDPLFLVSKILFLEQAMLYGFPHFNNRWCVKLKEKASLQCLKKKDIIMMGIRKHESNPRSLQKKQDKERGIILIKPIFEWLSLDVYLYIIRNKFNVNLYYKHGFDRTGCFFCPFKKKFEMYMLKILNPKKFSFWEKKKRELRSNRQERQENLKINRIDKKDKKILKSIGYSNEL